MMGFSYDKLRGRIKEVFGTQDKFAQAIGMSRSTLSQKLNNVSEFTQKEMFDSMQALRLDFSQVDTYFFALKIR